MKTIFVFLSLGFLSGCSSSDKSQPAEATLPNSPASSEKIESLGDGKLEEFSPPSEKSVGRKKLVDTWERTCSLLIYDFISKGLINEESTPVTFSKEHFSDKMTPTGREAMETLFDEMSKGSSNNLKINQNKLTNLLKLYDPSFRTECKKAGLAHQILNNSKEDKTILKSSYLPHMKKFVRNHYQF